MFESSNDLSTSEPFLASIVPRPQFHYFIINGVCISRSLKQSSFPKRIQTQSYYCDIVYILIRDLDPVETWVNVRIVAVYSMISNGWDHIEKSYISVWRW